MKFNIVIILFALTVKGFGQNYDVKPENGRVVIQLDNNDYMIKRDTSNGIISISFIPTTSLIKDLESQLGSLDSEISLLQSKISEYQHNEKVLLRQRKEVSVLLNKAKSKKTKK